MAASFIRRALQPTYKCLNSNLYKSSVSQVRYLSLSSILKARLFTKDHEWITVEGQKGTVGISDYAQEKLGEIVYVETPEVGAKVEVEDVVGCLESVKAASDIYSPVGGTVTEINTELKSQPSLINSSPLEQGWLYKIDLAPDTNTDSLMDEKAYADFCSHDE